MLAFCRGRLSHCSRLDSRHYFTTSFIQTSNRRLPLNKRNNKPNPFYALFSLSFFF
eukprot:FN606600.1.p1 GENE.FN606600.1~~FN606600.1.p1  ORF type:complete len:56 (-),score=1.99 FN606600.1:65-232(-)